MHAADTPKIIQQNTILGAKRAPQIDPGTRCFALGARFAARSTPRRVQERSWEPQGGEKKALDAPKGAQPFFADLKAEPPPRGGEGARRPLPLPWSPATGDVWLCTRVCAWVVHACVRVVANEHAGPIGICCVHHWPAHIAWLPMQSLVAPGPLASSLTQPPPVHACAPRRALHRDVPSPVYAQPS